MKQTILLSVLLDTSDQHTKTEVLLDKSMTLGVDYASPSDVTSFKIHIYICFSFTHTCKIVSRHKTIWIIPYILQIQLSRIYWNTQVVKWCLIPFYMYEFSVNESQICFYSLAFQCFSVSKTRFNFSWMRVP